MEENLSNREHGARIDNLEKLHESCRTEMREEVQKLHDRISKSNDESRKERNILEEKLAKALETQSKDLKTDIKEYSQNNKKLINKITTIILTIAGSFIAVLLSVIGFFLVKGYDQLMTLLEKLSTIPKP